MDLNEVLHLADGIEAMTRTIAETILRLSTKSPSEWEYILPGICSSSVSEEEERIISTALLTRAKAFRNGRGE